MAAKQKKASTSKRGARPPAKRKSASPAASIDKQLEKYRSMRDFQKTHEPSGAGKKETATGTLPFVIQKHAATRLHYDFRLGWRGVLKSWAVAKGPSYVVADKRLAVQVEDHPMEYGGFEGTIPKGQYGGGTVMLWDEGTWEPVGDADEGLRTGRLKFLLHGTKLQGHWTLVRMGGKAASESKPNWLLIKEHDEFERSAKSKPITEEMPDSVITGRDLTQIAAEEDHIWDSRSGLAAEERKGGKAANRTSTASAKKADANNGKRTKNAASSLPDLSAYPTGKMPGFIDPQLASSTPTPPAGDGWVHELKLDGYRIQAHLKGGKAKLFSRNGLDWTARMPDIASAVQQVPAEAAILDGEVVVLDAQGVSSFAALQASFDEHTPTALTYFCFDLLYLNGRSLEAAPLRERKAVLRALLAPQADDTLRFSEDLETDGAHMFAEACRLGAEGIVSKRVDAKYRSGRGADWTKSKCIHRQEFVIGGFTHPTKGGDGIGAVLLGYYQNGHLRYAGRSGTGFTQKSNCSLRKQLEALQQKAPPFHAIPTAARKDAFWVKPTLVAEIQFSTWTSDDMLRQASFKGLREDKPADDVKREQANPEDAPAASEKQRTSEPAEKPAKKTRKKTAPKTTHSPRMTHAEKVIDRASGLTKQQLADYYDAVAEKMLPHITDRPVSLVRCPADSTDTCFFQKHFKPGLPKGTESIDVPDKKTGRMEPYVTLSTKEALVGMAQMHVLEFHPWGARNEDLELPDRLIFDLDPDESLGWEVLAGAAEEVRTRLKKLGLTSFLKGTGGKGLHVVAPITPEEAHPWPVVKAFAHAFVRQMEADNGSLYLTKMTKTARKGKIYLDYLRNERGATAIAPYSPRRRAGMPVSVPFSWTILKESSMPAYKTIDFETWLPAIGRDPWAALPRTQQKLTAEAVEALGVKA